MALNQISCLFVFRPSLSCKTHTKPPTSGSADSRPPLVSIAICNRPTDRPAGRPIDRSPPTTTRRPIVKMAANQLPIGSSQRYQVILSATCCRPPLGAGQIESLDRCTSPSPSSSSSSSSIPEAALAMEFVKYPKAIIAARNLIGRPTGAPPNGPNGPDKSNGTSSRPLTHPERHCVPKTFRLETVSVRLRAVRLEER